MEFTDAVAQLQARGPGRMIPDLDRITRLASLLGDPQVAYPSVHVTGTNGKTSVVRILTTLLSSAGVVAGTYTSPHLQSIRERIAVAGRPISERAFADLYAELAPLVAMIDDALEDPEDHVTYFEVLTAMAYWWFADKPVEVGVFEVGMGGRWDATNLVRGDVAVLGPIDVDHAAQLGTTPEQVAHEKVGIIKPGATVVSGRQTPGVLRVIDEAVADNDATLWLLGEDVEVVDRSVALGGQMLTLRVGERTIDEILLPLFGAHQADNAALALGAMAALMGEAFATFDDTLVRQGFGAAAVPGRLEIVRRDPTVVVDGAHNPHGARTLAAALGESFEFRNLVLVVGCLADKDLDGILAPLEEHVNHVVVTSPSTARAASVQALADVAHEVWKGSGVIVETAADVPEALRKAEGVAGEGDGVLVTGSLYTVGAARDVYLPLTDTGDEVVYAPEDLDDEEDEAAFAEALDQMLDRLGDDTDDAGDD